MVIPDYIFRSSITRFALLSLRVIALGGTSRIFTPMPMNPRIFASIFFSTSAIFCGPPLEGFILDGKVGRNFETFYFPR